MTRRLLHSLLSATALLFSSASAYDPDFLLTAARSGEVVELTLVLKGGLDVNTRGSRGVTPLMAAAEGRNMKTASYLLDRGADPLAVDSTDADVLDHALAFQSFDIAGMIAARGADVNRINRRGYTRITAAAMRNDVASVRFLLDHSASTTLKTANGMTVYKAAKATGNATLIELLRTYRPPAAAPALTMGGPPSTSDYFTATEPFVSDLQRGRRTFRNVMFRGVDFAKLVVANVDFTGSEFRDCDFRYADCTGACMKNAKFYGCSFKSAVLRNAEVTGSTFVQPNFAAADLTGIKGLSLQHLRTVVSLHGARMDEDLVDYLRENQPQILAR